MCSRRLPPYFAKATKDRPSFSLRLHLLAMTNTLVVSVFLVKPHWHNDAEVGFVFFGLQPCRAELSAEF